MIDFASMLAAGVTLYGIEAPWWAWLVIFLYGFVQRVAGFIKGREHDQG